MPGIVEERDHFMASIGFFSDAGLELVERIFHPVFVKIKPGQGLEPNRGQRFFHCAHILVRVGQSADFCRVVLVSDQQGNAFFVSPRMAHK